MLNGVSSHEGENPKIIPIGFEDLSQYAHGYVISKII